METKNIFQSKTVIGSLIALFAIILSTFFGYEIIGEDKTQLTEIIVSLFGSAGALTAIYGRVVASKKLVIKS